MAKNNKRTIIILDSSDEDDEPPKQPQRPPPKRVKQEVVTQAPKAPQPKRVKQEVVTQPEEDDDTSSSGSDDDDPLVAPGSLSKKAASSTCEPASSSSTQRTSTAAPSSSSGAASSSTAKASAPAASAKAPDAAYLMGTEEKIAAEKAAAKKAAVPDAAYLMGTEEILAKGKAAGKKAAAPKRPGRPPKAPDDAYLMSTEEAANPSKKRKVDDKEVENETINLNQFMDVTSEVPIKSTEGKGRPKKNVGRNISDLVSSHSKNLFEASKRGKVGETAVAKAFPFKVPKIEMFQPPPKLSDSRANPDRFIADICNVTTRLQIGPGGKSRERGCVEAAVSRRTQLNTSIKKDCRFLLRDIEVLYNQLVTINEKLNTEAENLSSFNKQEGKKTSAEKVEEQNEKNFRETLVDQIDELPEDLLDWVEQSETSRPGARKRFCAILDNITMRLCRFVDEYKDRMEHLLLHLIQNDKKNLIILLENYLQGGASNIDTSLVDNSPILEDTRARLSVEQIKDFLDHCKTTVKGSFVVFKHYRLPTAPKKNINGIDASPVLPKGSFLSMIVGNKNANLYVKGDKVEDIIKKCVIQKGKINVSVEIPEKTYNKYIRTKANVKSIYSKLMDKIKEYRQMDYFWNYFLGDEEIDRKKAPSGYIYSRPDFADASKHLSQTLTMIGLADQHRLSSSMPNLIVRGAGTPYVNDEYEFEASIQSKPKYKMCKNNSIKIYHNHHAQEWRLFKSNRQEFNRMEKSPTLYAVTSEKLPKHGWRSKDAQGILPGPTISVKQYPGRSLLNIFGTNSSKWIDVKIVSKLLSDPPGKVKNPEECQEILTNINSYKYDNLVTREYRDQLFMHGNIGLKDLSPELAQEFHEVEYALLPFDGKCSSWFCGACKNWQDNCEKGQVGKGHNCGGNSSILGLKQNKVHHAVEFRQFIGETFAFRLKYEIKPAEKHGDTPEIKIGLSAHLPSVVERLIWMLYWKADAHRAKYKLQDVGDLRNQKPNYVLLSSEDIPPAKQPKKFRINLMPKQLCTLAWMIERENTETPFLTELELERPVFNSDLSLKLVLEREYLKVHGGILADEMGYGKTACVIGLIAATMNMPVEDECPQGFISSNATLIIAPINLFSQWIDEIKKFWKPEEFEKLKIIEIASAIRFKKLTIQDIIEADIVIVPTNFFLSTAYEQLLSQIIQRSSTVKSTGTTEQNEFEATRYGLLREFTTQLVHYADQKMKASGSSSSSPLKDYYKTLVEPVLEMFYFRRVVFDEFHEVMNEKSLRSVFSMQNLHGHSHWGLSGTPPLESVNSVQSIANFLHISVSASVRETQHFINEWVRSNTWDKDKVELKNINIEVSHTAAERVLYMQQKQNRTLEQNMQNHEERLLQLCTYFNPDGKNGDESADAAVQREQRDLQKRVDRFTRQKKTLSESVEQMEKLSEGLQKLEELIESKDIPFEILNSEEAKIVLGYLRIEQIDDFMNEFEQEDTQADIEELVGDNKIEAAVACRQIALRQNKPIKKIWELLDFKKRHMNETKPRNKIQNLEERLEQEKKQLTEIADKCTVAETQMRFFSETLKTLSSEEAQTLECSVCLEDTDPATLAITVCGHMFHHSCVKECIDANGECPFCRGKLTASDVDLVHSFVSKPKVAEEKVNSLGSKMQAILDELEDIVTTEPDAKIIMFVQWEKILDTVYKLLKQKRPKAHEPLRLHGSMIQRQTTLRDFIDSAQSRILLLSLEYSPTGMNLVCCRHVFMIHPMYAESLERAVAYEMQAIGRVRRQGQTRPVEVRRFITKATIEEEITLRHNTQHSM